MGDMEEEKSTKKSIQIKPITWVYILEGVLGIGLIFPLFGFLASLLDRGSSVTLLEYLNDITPLQLYNFGAFVSLGFLILIYKFQENILKINRNVKRWKLRLTVASVLLLLISLFSTIAVRNMANQLIMRYIAAEDIDKEAEVAVIPTSTPTHTATPSSTPTHTNTPTITPTPTLTPTSTPTPTPTPWLVENFSGDILNLRRWQPFTCGYPYAQYVVGAPVFELDGINSNSCYLTALLDEYEVNKILVEFELLSSYESAGFASLRTSCGKAPLDFEFDSRVIRYRISGRPWVVLKPHSLDTPVGITLIIEWLSNEKVSLSAYESQNMVLIRDTSLECSVAPHNVRFGASTTYGFPMILIIERVELSGPAKD